MYRFVIKAKNNLPFKPILLRYIYGIEFTFNIMLEKSLNIILKVVFGLKKEKRTVDKEKGTAKYT